MNVKKAKLEGDSAINNLARDLQNTFPGTRGFSSRNLRYMANLYATYSQSQKLQSMIAKISWTHNIIILDRCSDMLEREFYIKMAAKYGWTSRMLMNYIDNQTYEKTLLSETNFDKSLPENIKNRVKLALKDDYTFSFLELGEKFTEYQLEKAILSKVERFLNEMVESLHLLVANIGLKWGLRVLYRSTSLSSFFKMPCSYRAENRSFYT